MGKLLLVADEDDAVRELVASELDPGTRLEAHGLEESRVLLSGGGFDVVVLDLTLGDPRPWPRLLATVREAAGETPIIVLGDLDGDEITIRSLEGLCQEYLEKRDLDGARLARSIRQCRAGNAIARRQADVDAWKADLIAALSTELATPLAMTREFIGLVHGEGCGPLTTEQRDCLAAALRNCDRMAAAVGSAGDLDGLALRRTRLDAATLLTQLCEGFQPRCRKKGQQLVLRIEDELPLILADACAIRRVLLHLVSNAHRFAPADSEIVLRAVTEGTRVRIEVEDSGPGIQEADRERVFEPLVRGRDGGLGLGLAAARRIVDAHGGAISAAGNVLGFVIPAYESGAELPAFVADRWKDGDSLLLLRTGEDGAEHLRSLKDRFDDALLMESLHLLALVAGDGVLDLLGRLADEQTPGAPVEVEYALAPLRSGGAPVEAIQSALDGFRPLPAGTAPAGKRVLIVDDEPNMLTAIKRIFHEAELPIEIHTTTSGFDACIRFGVLGPDLVVLDIMMPDCDGSQALRSMREADPDGKVKFLAMSGNEARIEELVDEGCDDYLKKPFHPDILVHKIARLLGIEREPALSGE